MVPETQPDAQPATLRRKHRRKEVPEKITKPSITRWSEVEEVALARAYIDVSEDSFVGNNQTSTEFWKHVRAQFFSAMGRDSYRTNDMIFGKWRDLITTGENDETVMNEALMAYALEYESFSHIATWQVMRKLTKWHLIPKLQTLKRTKTSLSGKYTTTQSDSTGRCFVNLHESDEEVEMDMPPLPSPQRPLGRNKGKRPQASSSTDYKETLELISESLQKFVKLRSLKRSHSRNGREDK
ncbi:hypothetical protein R6Q59_006473 [Mikania micrantha]